MARYTDASCRLCRREGQKLFLKAAGAILINASAEILCSWTAWTGKKAVRIWNSIV